MLSRGEVFEAAVDGLGGAVGGAGPVEERRDVAGASFECEAEPAWLDQRVGHSLAQRGDECGKVTTTGGAVGVAVGVDHALVHGAAGLDLDVLVNGEQGV